MVYYQNAVTGEFLEASEGVLFPSDDNAPEYAVLVEHLALGGSVTPVVNPDVWDDLLLNCGVQPRG